MIDERRRVLIAAGLGLFVPRAFLTYDVTSGAGEPVHASCLQHLSDVTPDNVQLTMQETSGDVGGGIVPHRIAGVHAESAERLVTNFELTNFVGAGERVLDDVT